MKITKAWTSPFGIVLMGGSAIALIIGYVAGQNMSMEPSVDPLLNDQANSFNESALIEENIDPAYRNDTGLLETPPSAAPPPAEPPAREEREREPAPPVEIEPAESDEPPAGELVNETVEQ